MQWAGEYIRIEVRSVRNFHYLEKLEFSAIQQILKGF
ncbi:hypothetical protein QG37_00611 [Candidozyma auris]|uniref:Uncharacterized protein n=1 Tax=Candidozyma auris TaxID=498019 RepID=A0A0L0P7Y9_CANAR|nr:hypothetical protein QG37_00611 [[Candida] auris]